MKRLFTYTKLLWFRTFFILIVEKFTDFLYKAGNSTMVFYDCSGRRICLLLNDRNPIDENNFTYISAVATL